jgi:hypothetical protein
LEPNTLNRQLQFNVSFTLVPGQERPFRTKTSFAFKSLGEGKQRQPLSLSWAIDPVSFLAMAHEDVDRMEWDEHVLTIWTSTSRKRIDGRTGRLMDVVSEGESGTITISSSAGAFEPRVQAYLKDVDNYKQVYDPELPASSTLEFGLTTSILSAGYSDYEAFHALCTSPTVDILLKFIRLGGLRPLDDFCIEFFNWSENRFDIPFGDDPPYGFPWLALAASDQLFVRDTWPWQMWQAVSFVFAQQPTHVTDIWMDLNSREDGGPLSWLVIARFVKFLGKTLCEKAASRGLHVHSREAFLADARKLLDTRSSVGRGLRHMLFTAAKLTDEDLQILGDFAVEQGWIRHANPAVQFARRLRQAGPTEDPVIDALDEAWDDGIGAWLDNELRSLWGRNPFLDSAFPLDKVNTPPSTPPWVGKR